MERKNPEVASLEILPNKRRVGHLWQTKSGRVATRTALTLFAALLTVPARPLGAQLAGDNAAAAEGTESRGRWWSLFVGGFASSILAHEGAHIVASYAVGGHPSFGLNAGRPTIYSGIDATLEPRKQFVFSSAGLTTQSVIDEAILDTPHHSRQAGAFEGGVLAGGLATTFFYVSIGRTGSVSDVDFMARTSNLSKTSITVIYGGLALLQTVRVAHDSRYAHFFARPGPSGGMRLGMSIDQ
jgi:hypothetical protein